jgi:hypothetical protein
MLDMPKPFHEPMGIESDFDKSCIRDEFTVIQDAKKKLQAKQEDRYSSDGGDVS